ncbi:MAG TPA: histidine kinase [Jiangellaceae bacterium]|nr:histidine kinase [Jiangellaceae bacterium]
MDRENWGVRLRLVLAAVGVALGLFTLTVARSGAGFSLALSTIFGEAALLCGGWFLMVAGLVLGIDRRRPATSLLLYGAGIAWFLAEWDNPAVESAVVFSAGVALYAVCPAVVVQVVLAYPSGRSGSPAARLVVIAGYAVTVGVLGVASAMVYSPAVQGCLECARNLLLVTDQPTLWLELNRWGVRLATAWAIAALAVVLWRLLRASRASRRSFGLVSVCALGYLSFALAYYLGSLQRGFLGGNARDGVLWLLQAGALVLLSVAVLADLVRARLTHRALAKLVVDLVGTTPTGRLRDAMATRLGDPDLVIGYPIDEGGRFVDVAARDVAVPPTDGRAMTTLRYHGRDEAVLVHRPGLLGSPEAVEDLVSAVHLGLENEHLQAEALAQLADLRSSGVRIVTEGDEERRRLERDLHDGAQQRLVGLSLALRLLRSQLSAPQPELDAADGELQQAIAELRRLARGLYPVVLRDQGLAAALHALAESRHLRIESAPSGRLPAVVESTAYILVARLSECGRTTVEAVDADRLLVVDATVDAHVADLGDIAARVKTLAGSLEVTHPDGGATLVCLRLPVDRS